MDHTNIQYLKFRREISNHAQSLWIGQVEAYIRIKIGLVNRNMKNIVSEFKIRMKNLLLYPIFFRLDKFQKLNETIFPAYLIPKLNI